MKPSVKRAAVRWESNKKNEFKDAICNSTEEYERVSTSLDYSLSNITDATKECVDTIVKSLNKLLLNCAKKCSMVKTKSYGKINSTKSRKYKEWYDTECNDKRNAFNMAGRRYRDNKSEENLKLLKLTGKEYKTIINKSKAVHRQKCIEDLKAKESNDPKAFWNIINRTTKHPNTGNVTIDEFFEHFSVLNATEGLDSGLESSSESQIPGNVCNEYSESETLNSPITEDEVSKAVKRLKNGKACGEDCILNEMIKAFSENHKHLLTQTFNVVLLSGHVPNEWATGVIKPIYKNKGDINDPDNYRGITLLSCLGKLFTSVINERLTVFIDSNQIMSEAQAGFRKGYSTTDQIFTLKCIVELFLCQGRRLFCTFVDYSKAFDSTNRATLWKKTNIMWYIRKSPSCYIEYVIKSCVMANGMQSEFFESHVGLRQGENLSPILFALFLNDMETFFTEQKWNTLKFIDKLYTDSHDEVTGMLNLFVLMYADDSVIMAENEHDMQRNLNLLNDYCNCNKLKVNISKTKIMVFARSKTRLNNIPTSHLETLILNR